MDEPWRRLQREWEATPTDQPLLARLVHARRRAGLPVPDSILDHQVFPARGFNARWSARVRVVPPGGKDVVFVPEVGHTPAPADLAIPAHREWIVEASPTSDAELASIAAHLAADARRPPLLRLTLDEHVTAPGLRRLAQLSRLRALELKFLRGLFGAAVELASELTDLEWLSLSDRQDHEPRLPRLRRLERLTRLELRHVDGVRDEELAWLPELTSLSRFVFTGSDITDATLAALTRCRELASVELRGCSGLTDDGVASLVDALRLEVLRLGACRGLTSRLVDRLAGASRLEVLELAGQWQEPEGARLDRLPASLTRLCLSTGDTSAEQLASLGRLTRLGSLHLHGAWRADEDLLAALATLPALTALEIDTAPGLTPRSIARLGSAPELTHLTLERCRHLHDAPFEVLATCPLSSLTLKQVPLAPDALGRIARIDSLTDLSIEDPRRPLSVEDLRSLAPLSNLRRVYLAARRWSVAPEDAEQILRGLLPKARHVATFAWT